MPKLRYETIPELTRAEIEAAISRDRADELLYAVLSAALHADDPAWAEAICLRLTNHPHPNVRGNAVLGFGHIARLHGQLDASRVLSVIEAALIDPDVYVRGQANAAADDVEHFLGWRTSRPNPHREWLEGGSPHGTCFAINDPVRIVSGKHTGAAGSIISVLAFEPEPLYLVELGSGGDVHVLQSALRAA